MAVSKPLGGLVAPGRLSPAFPAAPAPQTHGISTGGAPTPVAPQASTHTVGTYGATPRYQPTADELRGDGSGLVPAPAPGPAPVSPAPAGDTSPSINGLLSAAGLRDPSEGFAAMGPSSPLNPNLGKRTPPDPVRILSQMTQVY